MASILGKQGKISLFIQNANYLCQEYIDVLNELMLNQTFILVSVCTFIIIPNGVPSFSIIFLHNFIRKQNSKCTV